MALRYIRSCIQMPVRADLKEGSVPLKILMFQTSGEFLDKLCLLIPQDNVPWTKSDNVNDRCFDMAVIFIFMFVLCFCILR